MIKEYFKGGDLGKQWAVRQRRIRPLADRQCNAMCNELKLPGRKKYETGNL